jgi:catechol 2,3-dioxygenase-like lactoylglutathione lyase family enzyme
MIDHGPIPVGDLDRSATFYDALLATVGWLRRKRRVSAIGFGPESRRAPVFWILSRREAGSAEPGVGLHLSFTASDRASVDAFFQTALLNGGSDAGAPE